MCVSVSPRRTVRFSDTVLYAAEVIGKEGDTVHVVGYQNKVQGTPGWYRWLGAAQRRYPSCVPPAPLKNNSDLEVEGAITTSTLTFGTGFFVCCAGPALKHMSNGAATTPVLFSASHPTAQKPPNGTE